MARRRSAWSSGPRLPLGPRTASAPGCIRDAIPGLTHSDAIAFDLLRYGKKVGRIALCGACFRAVAQLAPANMLTVTT